MYSNHLNQISAGLTQYIGAMLQATKSGSPNANYVIISLLTKEILKLAQTDKLSSEAYIISPLYKAIIFILERHMNKILKSTPDDEQVLLYAQTISNLQKIISTDNKTF